jgi:hypothetical protein
MEDRIRQIRSILNEKQLAKINPIPRAAQALPRVNTRSCPRGSLIFALLPRLGMRGDLGRRFSWSSDFQKIDRSGLTGRLRRGCGGGQQAIRSAIRALTGSYSRAAIEEAIWAGDVWRVGGDQVEGLGIDDCG